jgi:hypothetical protein
MNTLRAVARITVLVLVMVGFAGIQGGGEPAQAASETTRSWVYTEYRPATAAGVTHTATLTYSPTDSAYDAMKRACAAQGLSAPQQGASDLERIVAHRGNFFAEQANGGYAAAAFMSLTDREFAESACAGGIINWR